MLEKRIELLPVQTYPVGVTPFGPTALHDDVMSIYVELYRCTSKDPTIFADPSTFARLELELSGDGGKTWTLAGRWGDYGGIQEHYLGHEHDSFLVCNDIPHSPQGVRQLRGAVDVTGGPVRTGVAIELHRLPLHLSKRIGRWPQPG